MSNLERGLIQSPVKLLDTPSDNKGGVGGSPAADVSTGKKISRREFLNLVYLTVGGLLVAGCDPVHAATLEATQIPLDPTPRSAVPPSVTATPTDGPTSTRTHTATPTETSTSTPTRTATPQPEFWSRPVVTKVEIPVADGWNNKHEISATITTEDDPGKGKVFRFDSVGDKVKMERRGQLDWSTILEGLPNRPYSLFFPVKVLGQLEDLSIFTSFNGIELPGPSERGDPYSLQYMLNIWPSGLHIVAYYWRSHQNVVYGPVDGGAKFKQGEWNDLRVDVDGDLISMFKDTPQGYKIMALGEIPGEEARQHLIPKGIHGGLYGPGFKGTVWNGPVSIEVR